MKKKLSILGGGESGYGAAVLAMKQGYDVFLSDKGNLKDKYRLASNSKKDNTQKSAFLPLTK